MNERTPDEPEIDTEAEAKDAAEQAIERENAEAEAASDEPIEEGDGTRDTTQGI